VDEARRHGGDRSEQGGSAGEYDQGGMTAPRV
jgi:hypothetical protein